MILHDPNAPTPLWYYIPQFDNRPSAETGHDGLKTVFSIDYVGVLTKIKKYDIQTSPKGRHYKLFKSVHCKKSSSCSNYTKNDAIKEG